MLLPTEEQRLAAKLLGVDEEWAVEHYEEWKLVFKVFNLLDTNTRILAEDIYNDHMTSYNRKHIKDWETYRKAKHWDIVALQRSLEEYLQWFPVEAQPFSYYYTLAEEYSSKWHED